MRNLRRVMISNRTSLALLAIWALLAIGLIQTPVWDEQNMMLWLGSQSLAEAWQAIWLQAPGGVVRPLPQLVALVIWHLLGGREYPAFAALRLLTASCHGLGMFFLFSPCRGFKDANTPGKPQGLEPGLLLGAALFSQASLVMAGWFASVYDAMVTLGLGLAVRCAQDRKWLGSGLCLGLAFFCKESAVFAPLALPILALLPSKRKDWGLLLFPTALGIAGYFLLREQRIPVGSAADLHGFVLSQIAATAYGLMAGLPFGGVPASRLLALLGCLLSVLWWRSLTVPSRWGVVPVWLLAALLYSGMLPAPVARPLVHWSHFQGRLFVMPVLLAILATLRYGQRPEWVSAVALFTLSIPGLFFIQDHLRFQALYHCMVVKAQMQHGLVVHFPEKPFRDNQHALWIGHAPQARCRLEPWSGSLDCDGQKACPSSS
jgi:hypothetical protein